MKTKINHYLILNIPQTAESKDIRSAYLKLVQKYHPDKNRGNKLAEKKFQQINRSYEILKDTKKRTSFDQELIALQKKNQKKISDSFLNTKKEVPTKQPAPAPAFIKSFLKEKREEKAIDIEIPLPVSLKDLCQSSVKKVTYSRPYNGKTKQATLKVPLPKGVRPGQRIQFKEKGGSNGKKVFGHLFLKIVLQASSFIEIKKDDIYLTLPIPFTKAFKGYKKTLFSPYGKLLIDIPAKTRHNHVFRLKNLGLPKNSSLNGNMLVRIFIDYPKGKKLQIQNEMKNLSEQKKNQYLQNFENLENFYEKISDFEKNFKI